MLLYIIVHPSFCSSAMGPVAQHPASIWKVLGSNDSWIPYCFCGYLSLFPFDNKRVYLLNRMSYKSCLYTTLPCHIAFTK